MKQFFLILVLWVGIVQGAIAGYHIDLIPIGSNSYQCKLTTIGSTTWRNGDLITWVFPDGQYVQGSNTVLGVGYSDYIYVWMPYKTIAPNEIIHAFVAKKGGTGIPPALVEQTTEILTSGANQATTTPATFNFPPNAQWQFNTTWSFTPGQFTYLVISYKPDSICAFTSGDYFNVELPTGVSKVDGFGFNNEQISGNNPINITNLLNSIEHKHIFLKLYIDPFVVIGNELTIRVTANDCGPNEIIKSYFAKRDPHDPNEKLVNVKRICDAKNAKTLRYRVQFHNDGAAPVKKVEVWDPLASQLNPFTYRITKSPTINGMAMPFSPPPPSMNPNKKIEFSGPGLPGLGQTDAIYVYDQTIYSFEFEVDTRPGFVGDIYNYAVITFFDSAGNPLDPISTNVETVYYGCSKPTFCKCLKSLFRPNKERPKP